MTSFPEMLQRYAAERNQEVKMRLSPISVVPAQGECVEEYKIDVTLAVGCTEYTKTYYLRRNAIDALNEDNVRQEMVQIAYCDLKFSINN